VRGQARGRYRWRLYPQLGILFLSSPGPWRPHVPHTQCPAGCEGSGGGGRDASGLWRVPQVSHLRAVVDTMDGHAPVPLAHMGTTLPIAKWTLPFACNRVHLLPPCPGPSSVCLCCARCIRWCPLQPVCVHTWQPGRVRDRAPVHVGGGSGWAVRPWPRCESGGVTHPHHPRCLPRLSSRPE
jgi:hypothetical protein